MINHFFSIKSAITVADETVSSNNHLNIKLSSDIVKETFVTTGRRKTVVTHIHKDSGLKAIFA